MLVDFRITHFRGCTLFMVFELAIIVISSKKIVTGHELNQVVKYV